MHIDRKIAIFVFVLALGMTGFLLWLEVRHHHLLLVVLLALFAGCVGFGAFPAFVLQDRWFRVRERAHARWIRRHPRLAVAFALLIIVGFVYRLSKFAFQHWRE